MQIDRIKYTMKHRKAFRAVEKQLLGHNTIRGYLHDLDKVFLYMIMDYKRAHKIHRSHSMVIDWECARLTKPDKQMNARETLDKLYPELKDKVLPVIEELGL